MSVSRVGDKSKRRKGAGSTRARSDAMKDALPDVQPPLPIKRVREDEEPAAESDEEDD
jgi:hypothetical protein